jgi:hypothetical protein
MIIIEGKLIEVVPTQYKVRSGPNAGQIIENFTAQILHKVGPKFEVEDIKIEKETFEIWKKAEMSDVRVEIRAYAIADDSGGKPKMGFSLAARGLLPTILRKPGQPAQSTS